MLALQAKAYGAGIFFADLSVRQERRIKACKVTAKFLDII